MLHGGRHTLDLGRLIDSLIGLYVARNDREPEHAINISILMMVVCIVTKVVSVIYLTYDGYFWWTMLVPLAGVAVNVELTWRTRRLRINDDRGLFNRKMFLGILLLGSLWAGNGLGVLVMATLWMNAIFLAPWVKNRVPRRE